MTDSDHDRLLDKFRDRRGQDFVDALIDELVTLYAQQREADATIRRLEVHAIHADRMAALEAAAAAAEPDLLTSYELKADQFFAPETNIYGLEYTDDGTPYRWTGPEPDTTFLIPLDRTAPLRLILDFVAGEGRDEKLPLVLLVDGRPVKHELIEGHRTRLVATLPPRADSPETPGPRTVSAVTVAVRRTLQPSNQDNRQLGIGFFGLSVLPDRPASGRAAARSA